MKIYDCFSYWDEDLLLDIRLNILNDYVDFFVIVEGNKTWQNNYKEFRFDINKFEKLVKVFHFIGNVNIIAINYSTIFWILHWIQENPKIFNK